MLSVRIALPTLLLFIALVSSAQKKSSWIKTATGCKVLDIYPQSEKSITWTGSCDDSFTSGEGILTWHFNTKLTSRYEGNMKLGAPSGKGTYYYWNGVVEEGFYELGWLNGPGKSFLSEEGRKKYIYEGEFRNGLRHGEGYEVWFHSNGDTASYYRGQFADNAKTGNARQIEYKGSSRAMIIEGSCKDGAFFGDVHIWFFRQGKQIDYYEGSYGRYTSDGSRRNGYAIEIVGHSKYIGNWSYGFKSGDGKLYYDSTLVYEGSWSVGEFSGMGKRYYFDGSSYKGEFRKGRRHGLGQLTLANGTTYTGEFKDDLFNGHGYFLTRDKKPLDSGDWAQGRLSTKKTVAETIKVLQSRFGDKLKALNADAATAQR